MSTDLFLAALLVLAATGARAARVHVLLSADSAPYREAWEGVREELGADARMSVAGDGAVPGAVRLLVAFGAKASIQEARARARLVISMAPSVAAARPEREPALRVCMTPAPAETLARIKAIQPGLRRLGFAWSSDFYGKHYLALLRGTASSLGVEIVAVDARDEDAVPAQLRALHGTVDALWLPPDPLLLSERSFLLFRDFSSANRVPLYAPMPGLAERGAVASIGVSFRSIGREAGRVAARALRDEAVPAVSFPSPAETVINRDAAAKAGLELDPAVLRSAARTLP